MNELKKAQRELKNLIATSKRRDLDDYEITLIEDLENIIYVLKREN